MEIEFEVWYDTKEPWGREPLSSGTRHAVFSTASLWDAVEFAEKHSAYGHACEVEAVLDRVRVAVRPL